jgi:hypothetical protein
MATIAEILWNGNQSNTDPNAFFTKVQAVTQGPINLKLQIPSKGDTIVKYSFNTATGNTLKDVSGNGYNARISGAKWIQQGNVKALDFSLPSSNAHVNLGTKGFNSTLFMRLNVSSTKPSTLLSSEEGQVKISQSEISITNDNYTYSIQFNTTLSGWSDIALTSASYPAGSQLYLNGKHLAAFTYFIPRTSRTVPMGLVTPLDTIGGGFTGSISAFQLYVRGVLHFLIVCVEKLLICCFFLGPHSNDG